MAACAAHDTSVSASSDTAAHSGDSNVVAAVGKMVPQALVSSSNDVLRAPRVHLVTFDQDPNTLALAETLSALSSSSLWNEQTGEYGVGNIVLAPTIQDTMTWASQVTSGLPTASPNADVEAYLLSQIGGSSPAWGSVDANDLFVLVLPAGVAASPNVVAAPACAGNVMAWHSAVSLPPTGLGIAYVVVPSCPGQSGLSMAASQSIALVQTLVAAATNPRQAGFGSLAPAFAGWWLASEAPEAPHLCAAALAQQPNFVVTVDDLPQPVARTWSNSAFVANKNPCVPSDPCALYLSATPQLSEVVALTLPGGSVPNMLGLLIAAGGTTEVELVLADGNSNAGTMEVSTAELGSSDLTLTLAQSTGVAGDTLMLTIDMAPAPSTPQHVVQVTASLGGTSFHQYLLVRQSAT